MSDLKFWMVVCDNREVRDHSVLSRRGPRRTHDTLEDAEKEAERLAVENPGNEFAVLACVSIVHVPFGGDGVPKWNREP